MGWTKQSHGKLLFFSKISIYDCLYNALLRSKQGVVAWLTHFYRSGTFLRAARLGWRCKCCRKMWRVGDSTAGTHPWQVTSKLGLLQERVKPCIKCLSLWLQKTAVYRVSNGIAQLIAQPAYLQAPPRAISTQETPNSTGIQNVSSQLSRGSAQPLGTGSTGWEPHSRSSLGREVQRSMQFRGLGCTWQPLETGLAGPGGPSPSHVSVT